MDGAAWIPSDDDWREDCFHETLSADCVIHGLFVDDMMYIPTLNKLRNENLDLYKKDFEITGGGLMETFQAWMWSNPAK